MTQNIFTYNYEGYYQGINRNAEIVFDCLKGEYFLVGSKNNYAIIFQVINTLILL